MADGSGMGYHATVLNRLLNRPCDFLSTRCLGVAWWVFLDRANRGMTTVYTILLALLVAPCSLSQSRVAVREMLTPVWMLSAEKQGTSSSRF
jgi:hypothetical protein